MVTMYDVHWTDTAKKQYEKLTDRLRRQVDKSIERISKQPELGKPLRGELKGVFSERVSTFRILYKIRRSEVIIVVLVIEHRSSVYGGH